MCSSALKWKTYDDNDDDDDETFESFYSMYKMNEQMTHEHCKLHLLWRASKARKLHKIQEKKKIEEEKIELKGPFKMSNSFAKWFLPFWSYDALSLIHNSNRLSSLKLMRL